MEEIEEEYSIKSIDYIYTSPPQTSVLVLHRPKANDRHVPRARVRDDGLPGVPLGLLVELDTEEWLIDWDSAEQVLTLVPIYEPLPLVFSSAWMDVLVPSEFLPPPLVPSNL